MRTNKITLATLRKKNAIIKEQEEVIRYQLSRNEELQREIANLRRSLELGEKVASVLGETARLFMKRAM